MPATRRTWGYVLSGELVVTYTDGKVDTCKEHIHVMDHMLKAMKG